MEDWNVVVSMVEDFAQEVLTLFEFDPKEYDEVFDILTKDLYIYTLMVLKKYS